MQLYGFDLFVYGFICYDSWEEEFDQSSEWFDKFDEDGNVFCFGGSVVSLGRVVGDFYSFWFDGLYVFILCGLVVRLEVLEVCFMF